MKFALISTTNKSIKRDFIRLKRWLVCCFDMMIFFCVHYWCSNYFVTWFDNWDQIENLIVFADCSRIVKYEARHLFHKKFTSRKNQHLKFHNWPHSFANSFICDLYHGWTAETDGLFIQFSKNISKLFFQIIPILKTVSGESFLCINHSIQLSSRKTTPRW